MMLHRTLDTIIPRYRVVFNQHNISEQQWRILRVLWEENHCTTAQLSSKSLLPAPSMVGIIDRMVAKGLIVRERSEDDRRKIYVLLTPQGKRLQAQIAPQIDEVYESIVSQCDNEAWQTMITTLQQVIESDVTKQDNKSRSDQQGTAPIAIEELIPEEQ